MPTNKKRRTPHRRDENAGESELQMILNRVRELHETWEECLAWTKKNPHPEFPSLMASPEEVRAGRWHGFEPKERKR